MPKDGSGNLPVLLVSGNKQKLIVKSSKNVKPRISGDKLQNSINDNQSKQPPTSTSVQNIFKTAFNNIVYGLQTNNKAKQSDIFYLSFKKIQWQYNQQGQYLTEYYLFGLQIITNSCKQYIIIMEYFQAKHHNKDKSISRVNHQPNYIFTQAELPNNTEPDSSIKNLLLSCKECSTQTETLHNQTAKNNDSPALIKKQIKNKQQQILELKKENQITASELVKLKNIQNTLRKQYQELHIQYRTLQELLEQFSNFEDNLYFDLEPTSQEEDLDLLSSPAFKKELLHASQLIKNILLKLLKQPQLIKRLNINKNQSKELIELVSISNQLNNCLSFIVPVKNNEEYKLYLQLKSIEAQLKIENQSLRLLKKQNKDLKIEIETLKMQNIIIRRDNKSINQDFQKILKQKNDYLNQLQLQNYQLQQDITKLKEIELPQLISKNEQLQQHINKHLRYFVYNKAQQVIDNYENYNHKVLQQLQKNK